MMLTGNRHMTSRLRRGGGFLMLMLVAIPLMLFGVSLSADYGMALYYNRQASDVAENMSMAAGTAFSDTRQGQLDPSLVQQRAGDYYTRAQRLHMITTDNVSTPVVSTVNGNKTVEVRFTISTPMTIPSAILRMAGRPAMYLTTTVARSASICEPSNTVYCMYPVNLN